MSELSVNHLLGIKHLTAEDIQLILDTAKEFKESLTDPSKKFQRSETLLFPTSSSKTVQERGCLLNWQKSA